MDNFNRLLGFIDYPESFSATLKRANSMTLWWKPVLLSPIMMPVQM